MVKLNVDSGFPCSRNYVDVLCMKRLSVGGVCMILAVGQAIIGRSFGEDCCSHCLSIICKNDIGRESDQCRRIIP